MRDETTLKVIEYAVGLQGDPLQNCYKWQLISLMCRSSYVPKQDNHLKYLIFGIGGILLYWLIDFLTKTSP
jgi:hypothetical protein